MAFNYYNEMNKYDSMSVHTVPQYRSMANYSECSCSPSSAIIAPKPIVELPGYGALPYQVSPVLIANTKQYANPSQYQVFNSSSNS